MKILLAASGYPPEIAPGSIRELLPESMRDTEREVQALARALAARGNLVVVAAGARRPEAYTPGPSAGARIVSTADGDVAVHRIERTDLHVDHWQKSGSTAVARLFRELLRRERPDVLHLHHWRRLTRDLVHGAALEGVPAVVTLHDHWTTCLVATRVRPDTLATCASELAANPCLACAQRLPPKTPWVPIEAQYMALSERGRDLARELALARAVTVPSAAHAAALKQFWPAIAACVEFTVLAPLWRPRFAGRVPRTEPGAMKRLVIGAWGDLSTSGGGDLVLEGVRRARDPASIEVHFAGDEFDAGFARRLRALAAGLDVRFHGPCAAEALQRHPVSDVHALVSATRILESHGARLDEARALGLPSLLPRAGALAQRTDEARGSLFYAPGDPDDLARALVRLRDERGLWPRLCAGAARAAEPPPPLEAWLDLYARARALGPPRLPAPNASDWFSARMGQFAEAEWDRKLSLSTARELGFSEP